MVNILIGGVFMDEKNPPQKGRNGGVGEELSVTIMLFVTIVE